VIPQGFLDEHGGAVVENHLNMIYCESLGIAAVDPKTVCALLSTKAVDRAFRGISGSVAVSAYELNALPLPSVDQICELEQLISNGCPQATIERKVSEFYGEKTK
jgi:hypothetical protein